MGISYQVMQAGGNPITEQLLLQELRPLEFTLDDYSHSMNKLDYCSWIFEGSFVINHKGNLNLCCNCDVVPKHNLGSFLTQDISASQLKRFMHPICGRCTKGRLPIYKDLDNVIAIKNVIKEGIEAQMLKNDLKLDLFLENYNLKIVSDYFLLNTVNNRLVINDGK